MTSNDVSGLGARLTALVYEWDRASIASAIGILVLLYSVFIVAQTIYRVWFHPLSKVPGPFLHSASYLPFMIGNYLRGVFAFKTVQLHLQYGPIVRIGPNHILLDGEIGLLKVLGRGKDDINYDRQPTIHQASAHSILVAPGEIHRRIRRHMNHMFSDAVLSQQEPVINMYVEKLLDRLEALAEAGETVEINKWLVCLTFDIIGDLTYSESFSGLKTGSIHPTVTGVVEGMREAAQRRFMSYFPTIRYFLSLFDARFGSRQHSARANSKTNVRGRLDHGEQGPLGRPDFVSYMMRKTRDGREAMSRDEVIENGGALVIAGSETTATALTGFWFYVAKHPRVYQRLTDEIRTEYLSDDDITIRKSARLEYLTACVNEILRIYPPATEMIPRISPGDVIEGTYIPPGVLISVYQQGTFRNPKHFKDPDSFVPERWLPPSHAFFQERYKDDNLAVCKPFGAGSRDCMGQNLALGEIRLLVSRVLYRLDFDLLPGQDDWHSKQRTFVVWTKGPLMLRFRARE